MFAPSPTVSSISLLTCPSIRRYKLHSSSGRLPLKDCRTRFLHPADSPRFPALTVYYPLATKQRDNRRDENGSRMFLPDPTKLLAAQLRYVARHVPHFRGLGGDDCRSIKEFPFTFKPQIRNNYASFISDEFLHVRRPLADFMAAEKIREKPTDGTYIEEVYFGDDINVAETTGTSGTKLRCAKTMADRFRLGVGIWRQRRAVDPLVSPGILFPLLHTGPTRVNDARHCDLSHLKMIYEQARKGGYRWLHCTPYLLERHAAVFRRERWWPVLPDLKFIEFMGHFLRQETAANLSALFGTNIVDSYGMLETWTIALTCIHGVFHVNEHNVHVEIIDACDRPAQPGEVGRIVVTSLQERLMPFVRYVTGDFGMFIEKQCACRLGRQALALSEGRSCTVIKGVPGRVFGDIFFRDVLRKISCFDLLCIRIRQTSLNNFVVQTNAVREPLELMAALKMETEVLLGQQVRFRHVTFDDAETHIQEQQKPWLFRCEC